MQVKTLIKSLILAVMVSGSHNAHAFECYALTCFSARNYDVLCSEFREKYQKCLNNPIMCGKTRCICASEKLAAENWCGCVSTCNNARCKKYKVATREC